MERDPLFGQLTGPSYVTGHIDWTDIRIQHLLKRLKVLGGEFRADPVCMSVQCQRRDVS
jgi:hypothetical protein